MLLIVPLQVFSISASSYVVFDMDQQKVLEGSNIHEQRLIASISKIMTCIIAIENGQLDKIVEVDNDVLKAVGSSIYLEPGEKIRLLDLLYGMMLRSGNDASIMIAKAVSGSMEKFVILMNQYAQKIGMHNTVFYNSHGLEESNGFGNTSTAYDMALLTSYAMNNKIFQDIFLTKEYTTKSDKKMYIWNNKNKLLKYGFITGGKTGYTRKARRTLVTTGNINNIHVVIVTLNDNNDWQDHLSLYQYVNKMYKNVNVVNKKDFEIIDDTLFLNDRLYIQNDIKITLKKRDEKKVRIKYYLIKKKKYNDHEQIGSINIYLDDELVKKEPIFINLSQRRHRFFKIIKKILSGRK